MSLLREDPGPSGEVLDIAVSIADGAVRVGVYLPGEPPDAVVRLNPYGARRAAEMLQLAAGAVQSGVLPHGLPMPLRDSRDPWSAAAENMVGATVAVTATARLFRLVLIVLTGVAQAAAFAFLTRALARRGR